MWMVYSRATTSAMAERWAFPVGFLDDISVDSSVSVPERGQDKRFRGRAVVGIRQKRELTMCDRSVILGDRLSGGSYLYFVSARSGRLKDCRGLVGLANSAKSLCVGQAVGKLVGGEVASQSGLGQLCEAKAGHVGQYVPFFSDSLLRPRYRQMSLDQTGTVLPRSVARCQSPLLFAAVQPPVHSKKPCSLPNFRALHEGSCA